MGRHSDKIRQDFEEIFEEGRHETESEFLDSLNIIFREVAADQEKCYGTNKKLKIYELLQQISNCDPADREKYAKKIRKAL